jgi:hypothetical protein
MYDLFEWAKDSILGKLIYFGILIWILEEVKTRAVPIPSPVNRWLIFIGVLVGGSIAAALGTLIIGLMLRFACKIFRFVWLVLHLLPGAMRGFVFLAVGALVWLNELGDPPKWSRKTRDNDL